MEEWLKDGIGKKLTEKISVSAGDFLSANVAYVEIIPIKRRLVTAGVTTISLEEEAPEITAFSGFVVRHPDTEDEEKIPLSRLRSIQLQKIEQNTGLSVIALLLGFLLGGFLGMLLGRTLAPNKVIATFTTIFDDGRQLTGSIENEAYNKILSRYNENNTGSSPVLTLRGNGLDIPMKQPVTPSLPKEEQPRATETSRDNKTRWSLFGKTKKPQSVVEKSTKMGSRVITRRS